MSFSDLMNTLFGADWLSNIIQILSSVALVWITKIYSNIKVKLINNENENMVAIGKLLDNNIKINEKILEVQNENAELKQEVLNTSNQLCQLVNIVGMAFLDSKGVSSETKLAISKAIGEIEATGVDLTPINKTLDKANLAASAFVETVDKLQEQVEENIKDSTEVSEGIKETSLEIYNTILENTNE